MKRRSQLITGLVCEGATDQRFLGTLIERAFADIACRCDSEVDIFPVEFVPSNGRTFADVVVNAAKEAVQRGVMVLCVHTDADDANDEQVYRNKMEPALKTVQTCSEEVCEYLIPVIPVHMIEAWLLADTELLKREIGVSGQDSELGLHRSPEDIADPKNTYQQYHSPGNSTSQSSQTSGTKYRELIPTDGAASKP